MRGTHPRHLEAREELPAPEGIIADAAELKVGDRVVYPNQGVCKVIGVESKEIAGQKLELVRMAREEDGATVMVPKGKVPSIGLRKVATGAQMEGVFHYLGATFSDPELDWKVRHRDNVDRMVVGGILGVAEVVKGLHALSRIRPLPPKERELYDTARHLLVHEVAISLVVSQCLAEDFIDYALMPPVGVKFQLKAPPTPVVVSSMRPRKKRPIDELGLDDLALGLEEEEEAAETAPEAAEAESSDDDEGDADEDKKKSTPVKSAKVAVAKVAKVSKSAKPAKPVVAVVAARPRAEAKPERIVKKAKQKAVAKPAPTKKKAIVKKPAKPVAKKAGKK